MARTSNISMRWWWCLLCTRPTYLAGFFIVLDHLNKSAGINVHVAQLGHIVSFFYLLKNN